jgi:dTDP-4-amino-4,6-dideoxygalactose transaminase
MATKAPMAFVDLAAQRERLRAGIDAAIGQVLDHAQFIMGPEVAELEEELGSFSGAKHVISCANGTDALMLALLAKGLQPGDAVLVPSFTFCATAEPVCLLGGVPIFTDVDEGTYNFDPVSMKAGILTARRARLPLKGIITADLFGQPCDYAPIETIARENGLWMICDAAQSFGAAYHNRKVGTIGDLTTTSFFPAKPLGCYGDGGAVFTDDDELAQTMRSLRVHGQGRDKYENIRIGINGRLDTIQAAILLQKLTIFSDEIAGRNHIAAVYDEMLPESCGRPVVLDNTTSVWAQYTIRTASREHQLRNLKREEIPAMVYYPRPLHRQLPYEGFPIAGEGGLPVTDRLASSVLSLPMHPYLTLEEQSRVAAALDLDRAESSG